MSHVIFVLHITSKIYFPCLISPVAPIILYNYVFFKKGSDVPGGWLTPVILATQEAEIRKITV
jgi:hypothetical protein